MPDASDQSTLKRLPDGGPIYVETPLDPGADTAWAAEPWNTATAAIFILIPIFWLWHLRGRWKRYPFLMGGLPILLLGGVGGTLFHGLRKYRAFFLMDVIPIYFLGLAVTVYLWIRLGPRMIHLIGMIAFLALIQAGAIVQLPTAWRINVSYASLAVLIVIPIFLVMVRTQFRHGAWIYTALTFFAIAWSCRIADEARPPLLPMGTHWLWHIFGASATACLIMYVYRIEGLPLRRRSAETPSPAVPPIDSQPGS